MATIIYSEVFNEQKKSFDLAKGKHDADGASSVLTILLTQKGINLTTDQTAVSNAVVCDENRKIYYRQAERDLKRRDKIADIIFKAMHGGIRYLKSYYKPDNNELGDWGITVDYGNRVVYESGFDSNVKLFRDMKAKHDSFPGTTSPLRPFLIQHSLDLNLGAAALTIAEGYDASNKKLRRDAEEQTKLRNIYMEPVVKHLHYIGDFLMKLFVGNEQKVGEWGFTVNFSPREPKLRTSTVKPASQITIKGIVIGSILTNVGTVELHVYKGASADGTPYIVQANEVLGMIKGFSTITVVNPSTLQAGKIKVLVNK